ncbi:Proteophosphoglycan ppg4 [Rhodotorula toruloides ATCC 204091]|uniref:Proteophosphoglycan ppg4 n=2 Tax=Rhodotorula toruloides TaxID=5286 RepID=A0A2T0ABE1_RHOTO|nr:Proteophosphoglycan ppg4 [Rhodotorula toruloides ATCC 204091]PRQ75317.1 Proteophosphoglycan ppg4 [Rhodotorula toruloides]
MPATLDSLPDELLASILVSSAPPFKPFDNSRTQALHSLCLINKRIGRLAQDLLWRHVDVSFPDDHGRLETLPANLAARVKTLVVRLEPTDREDNGCAEPTEEDFAALANLPHVKTLLVHGETVRIVPEDEEEPGVSCFTYSTLCIDRSDAGPLRHIESLWINSAILVVPEVDAVAPFALTRLALYGQILVDVQSEDSDLSTLFTPAARPNLKVLRLALTEDLTDVTHMDVDELYLPTVEASFLDQLDYLQVELTNYSSLWADGPYTATSAPTLVRVKWQSGNLSKIRHLYAPQSDVCKFKPWTLDRLLLLEAVFVPHPLRDKYWDTFMISCERRGIKVIRCEEPIEETMDFVLPEFEAYIKAKRGSV